MNRYFITNSYGFIKNRETSGREKLLSECLSLSEFTEMGIYNYPVDSDSQENLQARLNGITASVGSGDVVFIQLPTGNEPRFETELMKLISQKKAKIVLLWHSFGYYTEHKDELSIWADLDCKPEEVFKALSLSKWHVRKLLIDAVTKVRGCEEPVDQADCIQIAFGVYDKTGSYTSWLGVTIQSIIDNTESKVHFHIVHDETMTELNRQRLKYICDRNSQIISFHNIDAQVFKDFSDQMKWYTVGALFRILLPEVCTDLSKVIYLDSDLLVNCDIKELWNIDISDYCLAAVPDENVVKGLIWTKPTSVNEVDRKNYFNSGVLYLNLDRIRSKGDMRKLVDAYLKENPDSNLPDQDALNVIYGKETLLIDGKWNKELRIVRAAGDMTPRSFIYHYVGTKPAYYWGEDIDHLYMRTALKTPWGARLYTYFAERSLSRQLYQVSNLEKLIPVLASHDKKLIFYGDENNSVRSLYELLNADKYESYLISDHPGKFPTKSFEFLKDLDRGTYVVFVLIQAEGGKALQRLSEAGLEAGKDYFVIQNIMDVEKGGFLI